MRISVSNHRQKDVLSYSLPLLIGSISSCESELQVENKTEASEVVNWPVINGKFKALVHLVPGENNILLRCGNAESVFTLCYEPLKHKKFVRLVYIKCRDEDGKFQAPENEDNSVTSACRRIALGAQMLQTFTAEMLAEHKLKAKTFRIEEDQNGSPVCHVFTSSLSVNDAQKLKDEELWAHFATELMKSSLRVNNDCKFLGFLSFTRYSNDLAIEPETYTDILKLMKGHVALGGGGLALFGSACLHMWSQDLKEVAWRFADKRMVDRKNFMDDSGNRKYHWACYATGLGATLHELGHTFDLGHTRKGIMGRGFDDIHKFFIVDMFYYDSPFQKKYNPFYQKSPELEQTVEFSPISKISWSSNHLNEPVLRLQLSDPNVSKKSVPSKSVIANKPPWRTPNPPEDINICSFYGGAHWSRSSALILYFHKWFNSVTDEDDQNGIVVNGSEVSSSFGLRVIEFRDEEGTAFAHLEFLDDEKKCKIDLSDCGIRELHEDVLENNENIWFVVEDSVGNLQKHSLKSETFRL